MGRRIIFPQALNIQEKANMKCAVANCKQNNTKPGQKLQFYRFPRNAEQQEHWIKFCRRGNDINLESERICSLHFKVQDFERNLMAEMGFTKRHIRNLKPGVVPTLEVEEVSKKITPTVDVPQEEFHEFIIQEIQEFIKEEPEGSDVAYMSKNDFNAHRIKDLEEEIKSLRGENEKLRKSINVTIQKIKPMQRQVERLTNLNKSMDLSMRRLFSDNQIKKLKNNNTRRIWTSKDINQSLEIYRASVKAYEMLCRKNFPLPSVRTLQRWLQRSRNKDTESTEQEAAVSCVPADDTHFNDELMSSHYEINPANENMVPLKNENISDDDKALSEADSMLSDNEKIIFDDEDFIKEEIDISDHEIIPSDDEIISTDYFEIVP